MLQLPFSGRQILSPAIAIFVKQQFMSFVIIKPGCYCVMRSRISTTAAFSIFPREVCWTGGIGTLAVS